ncbi:dehydrase and lipid transport-domain-containing protein [Suillus discolor]|uniref:Dehydrase and lipid transport-domain-containing protein n=1 Tax=Suillus discolor TaxID=1912936 RepID=A0A9P7JZT8_9AGAM|nr:dehydrase and lipid transport-domain-containing protein [Suillus discolor]KAG2118791.1 dehydrase and lipid transport-domain-containing protein [Suillus discolor]
MLRLLRQQCLCVTARRASHQRGFFTLPNFSPFSPSSTSPDPDEPPATQTYHERKIFPYGRMDLYNLVADVGSYSSFVPYCTGSRILERRVGQDGVVTMDAELMVSFLAFKESYISRMTCRPYESVQAEASSSTPLFKTLQTTWRFQPASSISPHPSSGLLLHGDAKNSVPVDSHSPDAGPTLVTLDIAFAFENPLYSALSSKFFGNVSMLMVQAFEERCLAVYGSGTK